MERKLKKYYPAVVSPRLLFSKEDSPRSKVLEWLVVTQKKAEFFWRDPYKNEVDMIQTEGKLTPLEIDASSKDRPPSARIASQELLMVALKEILYPNAKHKRAQIDVSYFLSWLTKISFPGTGFYQAKPQICI